MTSDYFHKVKSLVDTMASIRRPLQEEEVVSYLLTGLGSDYDAFVTLMITRSEAIGLNERYAHLLSYELCQEHNNSGLQLDVGANNVVHNTSNSGGNHGGMRTDKKG